eukprot:360294-Chlamydomonas_euryale.AAC.1
MDDILHIVQHVRGQAYGGGTQAQSTAPGTTPVLCPALLCRIASSASGTHPKLPGFTSTSCTHPKLPGFTSTFGSTKCSPSSRAPPARPPNSPTVFSSSSGMPPKLPGPMHKKTPKEAHLYTSITATPPCCAPERPAAPAPPFLPPWHSDHDAGHGSRALKQWHMSRCRRLLITYDANSDCWMSHAGSQHTRPDRARQSTHALPEPTPAPHSTVTPASAITPGRTEPVKAHMPCLNCLINCKEPNRPPFTLRPHSHPHPCTRTCTVTPRVSHTSSTSAAATSSSLGDSCSAGAPPLPPPPLPPPLACLPTTCTTSSHGSPPAPPSFPHSVPHTVIRPRARGASTWLPQSASDARASCCICATSSASHSAMNDRKRPRSVCAAASAAPRAA